MAKKRNCKRTSEEMSIHDEAVKLRKMTDAQLVEKVRSATAQPITTESSIADFIAEFAKADIAGIGKITIEKITVFAQENGYI